MLLAVDVGNTQTVFGLFDGVRLADSWRVATESRRTGDELGVLLGGMLDLDAVDGTSAGTVEERQTPSTASRSSIPPRRTPSSSRRRT